MLLALAAARAAASAGPSWLPVELFSRFTHFPAGGTWRIELVGEELELTAVDFICLRTTIRRITPSENDWRIFRRVLDGQGVWRWRSDYIERSIRDGGFWELRIRYADRMLDVVGINRYPDSRGVAKAAPTASFRAVKAAISRLLGGEPLAFSVSRRCLEDLDPRLKGR